LYEVQLSRSKEEVEILVWENAQALFYYKELVEAVGDVAARREAQANSLRDTAFAELGIPLGSVPEPGSNSWSELSYEQRESAAAKLRGAQSFSAHGLILERKLLALKKLQAEAELKFVQIKPQ
jgi:hypothetical protein